ncbi:MAG: ABC transporter permease [Planctomycetota bacterium]|jgi:phospholipid/cholesterol/gamma-HCH transport system permease protein
MLQGLGRFALREAAGLRSLAAVIAAVIAGAVRPSFWPRTVRDVLARQVLFTGVESVPHVLIVAAAVGIVIVVQSELWLAEVGQTALLGPILVTVIVHELGPLLTNFIVIARSGTAMTSELATMKVMGEVDVLESQGVDPFIYLLLPRVYATIISVCSLTVVFVVVAFSVGYVSGSLLGASTGSASEFLDSVMRSVELRDVLGVFAKMVLGGLITGTVCCVEGLSVGHARTELPQAGTRAVMRSITLLFVVSALISVISYA